MKTIIITLLALCALTLVSCKKEITPEPVTNTVTNTVTIHDTTQYTGSAHTMYKKIKDVTYSVIATPTIKKTGQPNTILPAKAIVFNSDINDGEFTVVQRPDFDTAHVYDLNLIFSGKSYLVDSVGSNIIYLKGGYNVVSF